MDPTAAATLFAWLDREVWVVTSSHGEARGGLVSTSVNPVGITPELPRVSVQLSKLHRTWELVDASGVFALHLLGEENLELVWRFGLESARAADKFAGLETRTAATGCPLLPGTVGWLDCQVESRQEIGDRTVFVAAVLRGEVTRFAHPLTTSRLLELAPSSKLSEMQRQRHHDAFRDALAVRAWRGQEAAGEGE
ncbi:MAG: flavin reductase family protein [Gemmataceae bacterium]|nr:flavin reductase family protein [Gemmataceae bacterium]